jgi:hypothetical protein
MTMFILYALVIGLAVGFAAGGRISGLAELHFRWPWVMLAGLLVQVILFSDQVTAWIGTAGPPIYVLSTLAVIGAVLANRAVTGMPVVVVGAVSNFVAIVANGGFMPADPGALQALGKVPSTVYSNSAVISGAQLAPLTDMFALPPWLPFANLFSIGDLLIGVGVGIVIVAAMRRQPSPVGRTDRPARA